MLPAKMSSAVTIRVPASTANLGPGYDCLGIALQLYNRVTVSREAAAPGTDPMAAEAALAFFAATDQPAFPFRWSIAGEVPRSRGLGSSVTVRLGILHGLNVLSKLPLHPRDVFELCARLEGHPDNAAPAAFGGFTVAGGAELGRFEVRPDLRFVLLIPDFEIATPEARKVLPPQLDRLEAVQSCANACRITAAFASTDYRLLRGAFRDGLHQPFREKLIPFLPQVIEAGEQAGALGGFLSGSGSTICCVTLEHAEEVAAAMLRATGSPAARLVITHADNTGMELEG
jgi:homoserine kinase